MCVFPALLATENDPADGHKFFNVGDYTTVKVLSCTSATLICELV